MFAGMGDNLLQVVTRAALDIKRAPGKGGGFFALNGHCGHKVSVRQLNEVGRVEMGGKIFFQERSVVRTNAEGNNSTDIAKDGAFKPPETFVICIGWQESDKDRISSPPTE